MPLGTIKKLVRTASILNPNRSGTGEPDGEGYGIISGTAGEQIFFVDSAVRGGRFGELERGQCVRYALEDGPLLRAVTVDRETIDRETMAEGDCPEHSASRFRSGRKSP